MDSPQSVVSPFKNSAIPECEKQKTDWSSSFLSKGTEVTSKENDSAGFIGVLDVLIYQARDIHNICIYHKQDVYAKLCLTSDPDNTVSTKIINGGGKNPVFNDNLRLNVRTVECSLKCEIWMLSRVKNYLEDQLLGFALVPMSEVIIKNGRLEREFPLSSTDLFHSPAGFVQLSLSYSGASPDVMVIPMVTDVAAEDFEVPERLASDFDKIEFPDPTVEKENESMVSEYFGISCSTLDSEKSESLVSSDAENHHSEVGVNIKESFPTPDSAQVSKLDSPPSSVSNNGVASPGVPSPPLAASSQSSDSQPASKSPNKEHLSAPINKIADLKEGDSESSGGVSSKILAKPIVSVNLEPEQNMVQQDIVDMYMKSMQQFTESLAKMKLPLDVDTEPTESGNSSSDKNVVSSEKSGSRVYYGSRAFF